MTGKIMRSILIVTVTVLITGLFIVAGFLYEYFGEMRTEQLRDELTIAAAGTEKYGTEYLSSLDSDRFRVTWVSLDGSILYDTEVDTAQMDNHLDREEITEALETGTGSSARYSSTLTEKTLYEAVRLSDGTVLRISVSQTSETLLLLGMLQPIVFILVIAIVLSAIFAYRMAKRITEPLNRLDLEHPLENNSYEELSPLLGRIDKLHRKIDYQMNDLERKKSEFSQVTDNMKEGLVLLDNNKRILSINPAAVSLFGASKQNVGEDFLTIDRKLDMSLAIDEAFKSGHSEIRAERNGREYQFDISRIESEGEICGAVLLAFDITEQANAEKSRREFSANVSHELKTPLQSIIGSAELIENGLVKDEDLPRFIGHIHSEAARLVTLIEDIIRLSQMDEGGEMPEEEISLYALAEEITSSLESYAVKRNIRLNLSGDEGVIKGVRRLIYEVIYNLCDNAVKYNRDGGRVDLNINSIGGDVVLTVADTGIGIPDKYQPRVFERFFRVDKSHSKKSGGTGLGLSIVKHAVQYHGGSIELKSEPDKGTTVTVKLPKKSV